MRAAVGLEDGLGLDGDRCIRVIPRHGVSPHNFFDPLISAHHLLVPVIVPTVVTEQGIFKVTPVYLSDRLRTVSGSMIASSGRSGATQWFLIGGTDTTVPLSL